MDSPKKQASKILRDKKMYQRWLAIFMCLALVVTSGTVTALKLTGQAMTAKQLQCSYVPHEHTDECYNAEGELICGLSDKVVHTHDSSCYDAEGALVCPLEELEPHEHDESCYTEVKTLVCGEEEHEAIPAHTHTEECYTTETVEEPVLSCGLEETDGQPAIEAVPGHVHTDECYTTETVEVTPATYDEEGNELTAAVTEERRTLTCGMAEGEGAVEGQPEIPAHHHTEECYTTQTTETQVLTCGLEEHDEEIPAHHHTDECYTTSTELTCGKEEAILHIHDDDCYDIEVDEETGEEISRTLTCDMLQLEAHQHGDDCFVEVPVDEIIPSEQPEEELPVASVVYCGKQEHTHTDECYQQDENGEFVLDENGEKILVCELEEHVHTEECFVKPEPVMLTATKTVGDVTVTVEYSEDANIPEGAELDFFEYEKDSETYLQRQAETEEELDRLFNIGFYLDGEEVEPAEGAIVKVNITYPGMEEKQQDVTHFTDEGAVKMGAETTTDGENTTVEFYTDSFSDWGVSTLADDNNVYVATVGQSVNLYADSSKALSKTVTWSSDDDAVSVKSSGDYNRNAAVTVNKQPSKQPVTIKASWGLLGQGAEFKVYVPAITGLSEVEVGNSIQLTLVGVPDSVKDVQWTANGLGEVTVSDTSRTSAKITGRVDGTVTVTASFTLNGKKYNVPYPIAVKRSSGGSGTEIPEYLNADKYISTNYGDGTYDLNLTFNASKGRTSTPKVDVVFVVDTSGSMDGTKMSSANTAVREAVKYLHDNRDKVDARFAVVNFANSAETQQPLISVTASNGNAANTPTLSAYGGTNYEAGLMEAQKAFNAGGTGTERVLIFLSDGKPTFRVSQHKDDVKGSPWDWYSDYAGSENGYDVWGNGGEGTTNVTRSQEMAEARLKTIASGINHFYAIAIAGENDNVDDVKTSLDNLINNGLTGSTVKRDQATGASESELQAVLQKILGRVVDVYCSNVTAVDNLQSYVSLATQADIGDKPALTVSIVDEKGNLISDENIPDNGKALSRLPINYQYEDADGNTHKSIVFFTAEYVDGANGKITGKFVDESGNPDTTYTLNTDWYYKITARIKVDETAAETAYDSGETETKKGINETLKYGVYTNKGMKMDYVVGYFEGVERTGNFPRPVVPLPRTLNITKVDAADETKALTGATFTLYRKHAGKADEEVKKFTLTNENGKLDITGIATGEYILKETTPPDNYKLPEADDYLKITVRADGNVVIEPNLSGSKVWPNETINMTNSMANTPLQVANEQSGVPVEIIKKGVKGVDLKGIEFTIGEENRQISEWVANPESGVIIYGDQNENLPIGITKITETLPTGSQYQTIKPVYVKVEKDDNATATGGYEVTIVADVKGTPLTKEQSKACAATAAYDQTKGKWVVTIQNTLAPITGVEIFKTTYGATGDNAGLSDAKFDLYVAPNGEDYSTELTRVASDLTTGKNGKIAITSAGFAGFEADKTYYLVETKAPAGYVAGGEPIKITVKVNGEGVAEINATTKTNNNGDTVKVTGKTITVYNSAGVELPHTGGIGTQLFTVGGGLLMVLAAGLYFWNKRRISEM